MFKRLIRLFFITSLLTCPLLASADALLVKINGPIDSATATALNQAYRQAAKIQSDVVILQVNSDDALPSAAKSIAQMIRAAAQPTVVFIPPNGKVAATSSSLLYAASVIAMAPASHWQEPTWTRGQKRTDRGLSADDALKQQVIDIRAKSIGDLLNQLSGRSIPFNNQKLQLPRGLSIQTYQTQWPNQVQQFLEQPIYAYTLLVIAIWCLIIELCNPGLWIPGILGVAGICAALYGLLSLPLDPLAAFVFALGIIAIAVQGFRNFYFLFGIAGVVLMVLGSFWLIDDPYFADQIPIWLITLLSLATLGILWLIISLSVKAHRHKSTTGIDALVGVKATIETDYQGHNHIKYEGVAWRISHENDLTPGTEVIVTAVQGSTLDVTEIEPDSNPKED